MNCQPNEVLANAAADEAAKMSKLEIIFGPWWRHYAVPYEFPTTLYLERNACPYCGQPLGILPAFAPGSSIGQAETAQLDHMDPISKGGEDSIRNAVYVCRSCNSAKGNRLFVEWLKRLREDLAAGAYRIYVEKHGHPPETFIQHRRQARLTLPRLELSLEEGVLRHLFPKPIVAGPPKGDI
ncbi:MAG: hypothetical protein GC139_02130 [Sideroxydans sp.]|nr:hypothetical protein [Sideroxydans sp.]